MIVRPKHLQFRIDSQHEQEGLLKELGLSNETQEALTSESSFEPVFTTPASFCFACGEKLTIPAVMWNGRHPMEKDTSIELWLHPACAGRLAAGLQRDFGELNNEKKT